MILRRRVAILFLTLMLMATYALSTNLFSSHNSSSQSESLVKSDTTRFGEGHMNTSNNRNDAPLRLEMPGARLVVLKSQRKLLVYNGSKLLRTYLIALGPNPTGTKERQGDGRTPEGEYYICSKNPKSQYYLSLGLSYPNVEDARRGLRAGRINEHQHDEIVQAIHDRSRPDWYTALGGEIFIHGGGTGRDWTIGCIALDNENMKELFDAAPRGLPVTIKP